MNQSINDYNTKQISVVILQLEIKNYLTDWLLSNIDPSLSIQLQHLVPKHPRDKATLRQRTN